MNNQEFINGLLADIASVKRDNEKRKHESVVILNNNIVDIRAYATKQKASV